MAEQNGGTSAFFSWADGEHSRILSEPVPATHRDMDALREQLERAHWVASEPDMRADRDSLARQGVAERRLVLGVLTFFAHFDRLVLAGFDSGMVSEVNCIEASDFYSAQIAQEAVHRRAYSRQLVEVLDAGEVAGAVAALEGSGAVSRMAVWARAALAPAVPVGARLVALAFVEGVLFCSSFASIQWFRERNALPGVATMNEFIARDEALHAAFSCLLVRRYLKPAARPAAAAAHEIARAIVALADAFVAETLPAPLPGLDAASLSTYVRSQADFVLGEMGYPVLFNVSNPFAFMVKLGLNRVAKTNFFERDVSSYQAPGDGAFTVALDADDD